jgi:predicted amidophosphoribosyltransferase
MPLLPVFASSCASCRHPGDVLCRACRFSLASSPAVAVSGDIRAAVSFDGAARSAILALKYGNRRALAAHLAQLMIRRLGLGAPEAPRFDVVTWAPTSSARAGRRGFDQGELLARHIARELGVPCRRLLYRTHGPTQTGRTRAERLDGPSFRARPARRPLRVLLVDDVVTTGSTLRAAAASLAAAGIGHVQLVAAAATPDGGRSALRHLTSSNPAALAAVVSLEARRPVDGGTRPQGRGGVRQRGRGARGGAMPVMPAGRLESA